MASQNEMPVYTGPWTDHSHGSVLGHYLTLSQPGAGLLGAFITSFALVSAAALWSISCFVLHQLRATKQHRDGRGYQDQVLTRNVRSPVDGLWMSIRQIYSWRGLRATTRELDDLFLVFSLFSSIAVPLLSTSSGLVTYIPSTDRLIRNTTCGSWLPWTSATALTGTSAEQQQEFESMMFQALINSVADAADYARQCYVAQPNKFKCGTYPVPNLASASESNARCPFAQEICLGGDTWAFGLTSQVIDSHEHLGINAPPQDRVTFQKRATCAPLVQQGFLNMSFGSKVNSLYENDLVYHFLYGPLSSYNTVSPQENITWAFDTRLGALSQAYTLASIQSIANVSLVWQPIDQLNRTDADMTILFIAPGSVYYTAPIDDPIFSAHYPLVNSTTGAFLGAYHSDNITSPFACADQYQICNPVNSVCSGWMGGAQLAMKGSTGFWPGHGLNPSQVATFGRLSNAAPLLGIYDSIGNRRSAALQAQEKVFMGLSTGPPLPSNQWEIEISTWFNVSLARLQRSVLDYVLGPPPGPGVNVSALEIFPPADEVTASQCQNQKTTDNGGTISFSVLAMSLWLSIGSILVILSWTIAPLTEIIRRFFPGQDYKSTQWTQDSYLHLLRRCFVLAGVGGKWTGLEKDIPTSQNDHQFQWYQINEDEHAMPEICDSTDDMELGSPPENPRPGSGQNLLQQVPLIPRKPVPIPYVREFVIYDPVQGSEGENR